MLYLEYALLEEVVRSRGRGIEDDAPSLLAEEAELVVLLRRDDGVERPDPGAGVTVVLEEALPFGKADGGGIIIVEDPARDLDFDGLAMEDVGDNDAGEVGMPDAAEEDCVLRTSGRETISAFSTTDWPRAL